MVGGIWHAGSSLLPLAWMICLWSHSNEELKLWNFSSFHWKADRRRRSVVKDTGELTHFWISQVAPRLRVCLQCWRHGRHGFDPWVGKISWKGECQPTPVFLPGQPHGQKSLVGYSPRGHKESDNDWSTHTPHQTAINLEIPLGHYNTSNRKAKSLGIPYPQWNSSKWWGWTFLLGFQKSWSSIGTQA